MKTINYSKSNANKCRRKIVIAEINILRNLAESQVRHEKIVREVGKLHSLWFQGSSKDLRIAELQDNWLSEKPIFMQTLV